MGLKNIKIGMTIKNYKILCELMDEEVKTGSGKISQVKNWERYFSFHKEGIKFIIDDIFDTTKDKIDKRKSRSGLSIGSRSNNKKDCPNFKINDLNWNSIGVYTITLGNQIYIGSTIAGFRTKFIRHISKENQTPYTTEMLENGATFQILWEAETKDEDYIRYKENQYIKQFRKDKEWDVVNINEAWNKFDGSIKVKVLSENQYIKISRNNYEEAIIMLKESNLI